MAPVPYGLADYGVGTNGAYSYNTTHILATVVLNTPPNVTNPSSEGQIVPNTNTGFVDSVYEFSLQLNTIESNVTLPGVSNGTLWTQNVLDVSDAGIHFVDDVFNMSYDSGLVFPTSGPASIVSGCGTTNLVPILTIYAGVYQCVGGTIPISAASYPITIQLYNNASVNAQGMDQVAFGYRIIGASGLLGTGVSDTLVFNNPAAPTPPSWPVGFEINGFELTPPTGHGSWLYDAEIIFGGSIGGLNAVFRSLNGTVSLQYSNTSAGPWQNVPSAYNFGADTAESAVGISGVWTPSYVEDISQGPTFLYGLWNSLTRVAVASGSIQFAGSVNPIYGFVFVSNVAAPGILDTNMSWVPTTEAGTFDTYVPPAIPIGGAAYTTRMYAAGVTEENGTSFSTSQTGYAFPTPTHSSAIRAPLYMQGNVQAASLAYNVSGRSLTSTGPYVFSNLVVFLPFAFTHVNDFFYPSFTILQAEGLTTTPIYVNNTVQGSNFDGSTFYERNRATSACGEVGSWDAPPGCYYVFTNYSEQFNIFDSWNARVTNETLSGDLAYGTPGVNGGTVIFFHDTDAYASDIVSTLASYGVFNGLSSDSHVQDIQSLYESNGIDDVASTGTVGWNIFAYYEYSFGVYALGSSSGTFTWINATDYASGYYSGYYEPFAQYALLGSHNTHVSEINATDYAVGAVDSESMHDSFSAIGTYEGAGAVYVLASFGTTVTGVSAYEAWGVDAFYSDYTNITNYVVSTGDEYDSVASILVLDGNTTMKDATVYDYSYGVESEYNYLISFTNFAVVDDSYIGVLSLYDAGIAFTNTWLNNSEAGALLEYPSGDSFTNVNSNDAYVGFEEIGGTGNVVTGLSSTDSNVGGAFVGSTGGTVADVSVVSNYVDGFYVLDDVGVTVTTVDVTMTGNPAVGSAGVVVYSGGDNAVTTVTATDGSVGVMLINSTYDTVSDVSASDSSIGVLVDPSSWVTVSTVTASAYSIGVVLNASTYSTVHGVTATNSTLSLPFVNGVFGFPVAAVDTEATAASTVTDVTATMYPSALIDAGSDGITVAGLNATLGYYGVYLADTYMGTFSGIGAYLDQIGFQLTDSAQDNTITASSFVDDVSYGVSLIGGSEYNTVYGNNFIGNNGATGTYSAAHIQAWSGSFNYFDLCSNSACTSGVGNYWADWHTYGSNGYLAPYLVTGDTWDYFPLGPQETFEVQFNETGLAPGTSWSVTLGGITQTSTNTQVDFFVALGTYSYQVNTVAGYTVSPAGGTLTEAGAAFSLYEVAFTAITYAVTLSESGLSAGTSWGATVNGVTQSATGTSLTFYLPAGSYTYSFSTVSGYNLPATGASGKLTVTNQPVSMSTTYSPVSTPSYVQTSDFNNWLAVAIAIAVIALVVGLLALLLRGRKEPPTPSAQPWTPPPPSAAPPPATGGSSSWSEGPPSGGSPPS